MIALLLGATIQAWAEPNVYPLDPNLVVWPTPKCAAELSGFTLPNPVGQLCTLSWKLTHGSVTFSAATCQDKAHGDEMAAAAKLWEWGGIATGKAYRSCQLEVFVKSPQDGEPWVGIDPDMITSTVTLPTFFHRFVETRVKSREVPNYPPSAKGQGEAKQRCTLDVQVDAGGVPSGVDIVNCLPAMVDESTRAALAWRFYPKQVDGVATESTFRIVFEYKES